MMARGRREGKRRARRRQGRRPTQAMGASATLKDSPAPQAPPNPPPPKAIPLPPHQPILQDLRRIALIGGAFVVALLILYLFWR